MRKYDRISAVNKINKHLIVAGTVTGVSEPYITIDETFTLIADNWDIEITKKARLPEPPAGSVVVDEDGDALVRIGDRWYVVDKKENYCWCALVVDRELDVEKSL
jgi:hypothetical protein